MKATMKRKSAAVGPKTAQIGASWRGSENNFRQFFADATISRRAKDWKVAHDHYLKALQWAMAEERS